jgi:hypothetical protein
MKCSDMLGVAGFALAFAFLAMLPTPALATTTADVLVGINTLNLLSEKPTGKLVVALVFDPSNFVSMADAQDVMGSFDIDVGAASDMKLSAMLVPVTELGKLSKARVAVVMQGAQGSMAAIATAANAAHILTMSADLHCVQTGKCILGVLSEPTVEIYYSKQAAEAASVKFAPAFLMLVKQI